GDVEPQPAIIGEGGRSAEARWTARAPVSHASIRIAESSSPGVAVDQQAFVVDFVPPIKGLDVVVPSKLPLLDRVEIVASFRDGAGHIIKTAQPRVVTFVAETSNVTLSKSELKVAPGAAVALVEALPK